MSDREIWFPAKRYGWGWGAPIRWQGWAVIAVFIVLLVAGAVRLHGRLPMILAYTACLSAVLVAICWLKGEKPKWRWGDRN